MSESCLFTSMIHCPTEPEVKNTYSERKKFLLFLCFGWLVNLLSTSLVAQTAKNLSAMQETQIQSLGQEDPLEMEMAIHFSILAWRIPWTEEPGRLQSMGLQRVGHDWVNNTLRINPCSHWKLCLFYSVSFSVTIPAAGESNLASSTSCISVICLRI